MVTAVQGQPRSQPPQPTQHMLLQGIAWETFETLIRDLESQPSKRLTYDDGMLEIWMPLPSHKRYKKFLARFVERVTEELEIEICSVGSCTWRRPDLIKGAEADECYYIQSEALVRGRMKLDLAVDPPPDLAIEIDITSLSLPRLPIYAALGVPEVWRFDGERLVFLRLVAGKYEEMERSLALPLVTVGELAVLLERAPGMGETSWARSVGRWVRERLE